MPSTNSICLLINQEPQNRFGIRSAIGRDVAIEEATCMESAIFQLRTQQIAWILIACSSQDFVSQKLMIIRLKSSFPLIPIIGLVPEDNLELVLKCGQVGIDGVVALERLGRLKSIMNQFYLGSRVRVLLRDFSLDWHPLSDLAKKALRFIEQHYISLVGVNEISAYLDINESTLAREFKKCRLVSPKRLLLYFKISHATNLMLNKGLTIKEIANLSGFSNEKRFSECFRRVFQCTPKAVRREILSNGFIINYSGQLTNHSLQNSIFQKSLSVRDES